MMKRPCASSPRPICGAASSHRSLCCRGEGVWLVISCLHCYYQCRGRGLQVLEVLRLVRAEVYLEQGEDFRGSGRYTYAALHGKKCNYSNPLRRAAADLLRVE